MRVFLEFGDCFLVGKMKIYYDLKKIVILLQDDDEDCPVDADICLRVKDLVSIAWQVADGMVCIVFD